VTVWTSAYRALVRPALFRWDAEEAHLWAMAQLAASRGRLEVLEALLGAPDERLSVRVAGLHFQSPVGLAAGLDKHGEAPHAWPALGFGFYELGTITPRPQAGNPRPRVFRLVEDAALINRFGFNSVGAAGVAAHLRGRPRRFGVPQGINVGKNRDTPAQEAAADHRAVIEALGAFADYFVVNVSSPNTAGLRALQSPERIEALVRDAVDAARGVPMFVKLAPDWDTPEDLDATARAVVNGGAAGLIVSNTTLSREGVESSPQAGETGGLSGRPLKDRALAALVRVRAAIGPSIPIVGVGGIESAEDAWARLEAGASLVQVYTALVYQGPGLAHALNAGLAARCTREGLAGIADLTRRWGSQTA